MLLFWAPPMFSVAPEALAAPYADEIGIGSAGLGLLMCALPVGTIAGELYAGSALGPATRSRVVLPLAAATLLPLTVFALTPASAGRCSRSPWPARDPRTPSVSTAGSSTRSPRNCAAGR